MKYRSDIYDFITSYDERYDFKHKNYRPYEQNGLIYMANYENNKIISYNPYSVFLGNIGNKLLNELCEKFDVNIAKKNSDIVCRCGESKKFSACYGNYELILKCNCGNSFTAYSG